MNSHDKIVSLASVREEKEHESDRECARCLLESVRAMRRLRPDMSWFAIVAGNSQGQHHSSLYMADDSGINPLYLPELTRLILSKDLEEGV